MNFCPAVYDAVIQPSDMFTRDELEAAWPDGTEAEMRNHRTAQARLRYRADPDKARAADKRKRDAAPHIYRAKCNARDKRLRNATPPWVDRAELKRIYELAAWLGMQVDHIHPLKGRNFCGLHVPWNLQLLTASENAAKGNRLQDT